MENRLYKKILASSTSRAAIKIGLKSMLKFRRMSLHSYKFTCINCGSGTNELYRKYSASVLKLAECKNCKEVADKYIEYDLSIVIIDLILFSKEAYRHVLYNTNFKVHWKLMIMLQIMETYAELKFTVPSSENDSERDLMFYILGLRVIFRNAIFILTTIALTFAYNGYNKLKTRRKQISLITMWKGMVLSYFGLFLLIPSLIWNSPAMGLSLTLVSLYVSLSQLITYTVICECPKPWSIVVVLLSYYCKWMANGIYNHISHFAVECYTNNIV